MALAHPIADELRAAGVITDAGGVDEAVLEWLTVLSRRDVALLIYAQTPTRTPRRNESCWRASPSGGLPWNATGSWSGSPVSAPRVRKSPPAC